MKKIVSNVEYDNIVQHVHISDLADFFWGSVMAIAC